MDNVESFIKDTAHEYQKAINNYMLNEYIISVFLYSLPEKESIIYTQRYQHKKSWRSIAKQVELPWTKVRKEYNQIEKDLQKHLWKENDKINL